MHRKQINKEVLEELRKLNTPTVSNAIEVFDMRPRNSGFMDSSVKCITPELGVMVGYAVTAKIRAKDPALKDNNDITYDYWKNIEKVPEPRVLVIEDLDQPKAIGAFWGEVQAHIHKALGCVGTVTDGGVRDVDEVKELGFHLFASSLIVSHAYVHIVEFGKPVKVGGIEVKQGDLIHGDKHGVLLVPIEIADKIPKAAQYIGEKERKIFEFTKSKQFNLDILKELMKELREAYKKREF
ncbi:MAG: RraA family protein [Nitrososphaerales archaeon]